MSGENTKKPMSMKAKVIMLVAAPVIVIIICSFVIYFSAQKLESEPTAEPSTTPEYLLKEPTDEAKKRDEVNSLLDGVLSADDVQIEYSPSVEVSLKSSSLPEKENRLLTYAVGQTGDKLSGEFFDAARYSTAYGKKPLISNGIYPKTGETIAFDKNDDGEFVYTFVPEKTDGGMFFEEDEKMLSDIKNQCAEFMSVQTDGFTAVLSASAVTLTAVPLSGKAKSITVTRSYTLTFGGSENEPSFTAEITAAGKFDIAFAGIEIEQDVIEIHDNGYDELAITANVDENASRDDFSVVFVSSDPSVCTVDENGTVEAVRTCDTPVTVTVTLTYLGKTYSDKCLVYVTDGNGTVVSSVGKLTAPPANISKEGA